MKRSTWLAVLVTAAVLVVAGSLPRLSVSGLAASWRAGVETQVRAWPRLSLRMPAVAATPRAGVSAPQPAAQRPARRALVAVAPARLLATPPAPARAVREFRLPAWPALAPYAALPVVAGALLALLLLGSLGLWLRRDPRSRVWQLARRGQTLARIARSARIPQDAVRSLLTPGLGARR